MPWNYDPNALATSEKDQVRLEIQDTDPNNKLLQDEEIEWFLTQERNFWSAAARCCEAISRRFFLKADVRLGRSLFLLYSKTAEQYGDMATRLRRKAIGTNAPWVGGMSVTEKSTYQTQTDIVQPAFARDMQENPQAGGLTADVGDPSIAGGTGGAD